MNGGGSLYPLLDTLHREEQRFQETSRYEQREEGENFPDLYLQLCSEVADIMVGKAIQDENRVKGDPYISGTGLPWLARTFGNSIDWQKSKWSIPKDRISVLAIQCFIKVTEHVLGINQYQLRPHPTTSLLFAAGIRVCNQFLNFQTNAWITLKLVKS